MLKVGGNYLAFGNQKTEILKIDENKNFNWSVVEPCFEFSHGKWITGESFDINEEYVLLIGGFIDYSKKSLQNVFKFNGTWFVFEQLNNPRELFQSIYWNGAVNVIGGWYCLEDSYENTKMEIWNIKESSDQFKTEENWSELFRWRSSNLFIVPDAFFPDHWKSFSLDIT